MREIKFRGKTKHGEWKYGYYKRNLLNNSMITNGKDFYWHEVIPETIGQYTGLKDCKGKEIFEGDVVKTDGGIWTVYWLKCGFRLTHKIYKEQWYMDLRGEFEVIGNIHEQEETE